MDPESGLYYNWHRFYDPSTGRYISADPIGLDGGMNLYLYANANPLNYYDPTGLDPCCLEKCLRERYGDFYDIAYNLTPFSLLSVAAELGSQFTDFKAKRSGIRKINTGRYKAGKRELGLLKGLKFAGKLSGAAGIAGTGIVVGAQVDCRIRCGLQ